MECNYEVVSALLTDGLFELDEIHPDSAGLFHLWTYVGQVNSGGHEAYVSNVGWQRPTCDHLQRILPRIGASDAAALFRTLRQRLDTDDHLRLGMARRGGFNWGDDVIDPWSEEIDSRFFQLDDLYKRGSEYLRTHPDLEVVETSLFGARLTELIASNPLLEARRQTK
jgi:hypothetical protein